MVKYLVTSGCSFSDNHKSRWPHFLAEKLGLKLYNRGQGSAGNDWISMSTIYQIKLLLDEGIAPNEILTVVMWSGIGRGGIFINGETYAVDMFTHTGGAINPISFYDSNPNEMQRPKNKGFLVGSPHCGWKDETINKIKKIYFENIYNSEWQIITSLNYWLQLQWFCKSYNIKLFNMTYSNIFMHPWYGWDTYNKEAKPFFETYKDSTKYLFDMLDIKKWWFDNDRYDGMYEWMRRKNYTSYDDGMHPSVETHEKFTEEVLLNFVAG